MKFLHILTGTAILIVFAVSGQYMAFGLELPNQEFDAQRMMYRASHMYLLFVGGLNVAVGCYWYQFDHRVSKVVQRIASFCLVLAQPVLVYAFWVEPADVDSERLLTLLGCVLVLIGIVLSLIGASVSRIYGGKNA